MWRAGGPGGAVRWAPSPARLSLPKVAVPCLPGLGTRSRIGVRFSADISQSGQAAWWGWREYRGKSVRGRRWRPRPDIGPGDWTSSGRPAPSGPVLSQCPECENGLRWDLATDSLFAASRLWPRWCSVLVWQVSAGGSRLLRGLQDTFSWRQVWVVGRKKERQHSLIGKVLRNLALTMPLPTSVVARTLVRMICCALDMCRVTAQYIRCTSKIFLHDADYNH